MKKSLFTNPIKKNLLAVSACSLMLGASYGGTVALNINSYYYNTSLTPWQTGDTPAPVGAGFGYQTSGWLVTAPAFGVPAANWYAPLVFAWWSPTPVVVTQPMGTISAHLTAPAAIDTGIGEQNGGFNDGVAETVAPGNDQVTWSILQSQGGVSPAVELTGLAANYPNGYVVQTIAAARGAAANFNGVGFTDGVNTTHSDYNINYYEVSPASNPDVAGGRVALSDSSGVFTSDTLQINCDAQTANSNSVLCGFIITDVPVVTRNVPANLLLSSGSSLILPTPTGIIGIGLTYQWQHAGTNIPGATFSSFTNNSMTTADSGLYQVMVTSSYYPSISVTGQVANVAVVPPHAARMATFDANTAVTGAQDGSGAWNYTLTNWWSGSFDDYWGNADAAVFGAGGNGVYKVTLGASITASSIAFNSGAYTLTNTAGETLTLQGSPALTGGTNGTISVPVTITTNTLLKLGAGKVTLAGPLTGTNVFVGAGTLEVLAKSGGDATYEITNGATLKIGYSTGGGYANTGLQLYGDGTAATTGLYLLGGKSYSVSGGVVVNNAPTTIRQYGSGMAAFEIFDINSNPGLSITAAASGSIVDANIQMVNGGYGMVVTTAAGVNTTTGDLILNGPLNVDGHNGVYGLVKKGLGSIRLNAVGGTNNCGIRITSGTVLCGINNCIGTNGFLDVRAGATIDLNGTSQVVSNASLAGTLKMTINKGAAPNCNTLNCWFQAPSFGGTLVVTNLGGTLAQGDTFHLFPNTAVTGFSSLVLPTLANGLAWQDDSALDGTIKVVAGSVPPSVVTDLSGTTNLAFIGGGATLAITASGDPILHYLWKKNGTTSIGADSPTLVLTSLTAASAGFYSCTITNNFGSVSSLSNYLVVVTPSSYVATVMQDRPRNFWPLNETNPSTAYDYSGGKDGNQNGGLTMGAVGPVPPSHAGFDPNTLAYQFDGGTAYVDFGTGPALSGTTDFSLEAWVNTSNQSTFEEILQQRYSAGFNGEYQFGVNTNGTIYFMVYGGGASQFNINSTNSSPLANDGNWHHVVAVRNGTNGCIYLDGVLVGGASGPVAPLDPTFTVAIGIDLRDFKSYFEGSICDVAIYQHALTSAQVANHASTGIFGASAPTLSLVGGSLVWSSGTLVSSPVLGAGAVWTPVAGAVSPYHLPPASSNNSMMFYRLLR